MAHDQHGVSEENEELTDISELLDERKAVTTTRRKRTDRELTDLKSVVNEGGSDTRVSTPRAGQRDDSSRTLADMNNLDPEERERRAKTLVLLGYGLVGLGLMMLLVLPQDTIGMVLTSSSLVVGVLLLGSRFFYRG